ncbi:CoA pyrophosphatase [Polynucleobacter kasalickyi]|uniref:8-oxo-dGTP pyrophosphatase MutT, NUDIX family n=1 Tax=Polynucleobacter kasalickyi TaxID=1938817 RepID=A0A1W1YCL0_9BURK|nr:CoA pyrophosphatase [Polynucleobacter kasalickyi]SMC33551.1 8-oxo-dGTP pyrophosphatase MutT, NUDIX family [Polynucleobacter kasalickyi]
MRPRVPKYDPQLVPILVPSLDTPAIDEKFLNESALRQRFTKHFEWAPELTDESRMSIAYLDTYEKRIAGVLVPLVNMNDEIHVLLTQRAAHLNDHAGQISFPGGRKEDADLDIQVTALREAHEEIGLHPTHVEILGALPDYHTITGYQVTPVVGIVKQASTFASDTNEVDEIFMVPLAFLMNPANHQIRQRTTEEGSRTFYAMPYENRFIWGATAGMLRNLYHFLRAAHQ